ncbi:dTDP-4-dehydrorhamnose 3,5-epimerase [Prochlorococcus sp. MIT 0916]|uniref:dTDP-4-dehydrorhamnose 3,5-epimerase n=1 Tax=Prochlorococcus sp. MIT 0916 TaxID=3082521 RepID=UPI0039B5B50B
MKFTELTLSGAYKIEPKLFNDERGFFSIIYSEKEFNDLSLNNYWPQINNSYTLKKGTLRGLHFQYPPYSQTKLVRVFKGAIFDVIVDLRKSSPTYSQYYSHILTEKNRTILYVPEGFAHGFITIESNTEIIYCASSKYKPKHEGTLIWNDPTININWPLEPQLMSNKDRSGKSLENL